MRTPKVILFDCGQTQIAEQNILTLLGAIKNLMEILDCQRNRPRLLWEYQTRIEAFFLKEFNKSVSAAGWLHFSFDRNWNNVYNVKKCARREVFLRHEKTMPVKSSIAALRL